MPVPIVSVPLVRFVAEQAYSNALVPITQALEALIVIELALVQFWNAEFPILVTPEPIVIVPPEIDELEQECINAYSPIVYGVVAAIIIECAE